VPLLDPDLTDLPKRRTAEMPILDMAGSPICMFVFLDPRTGPCCRPENEISGLWIETFAAGKDEHQIFLFASKSEDPKEKPCPQNTPANHQE
jgi:hypothetical protein